MPPDKDPARSLLARVVQAYYGAVGSVIAGRREEAETRLAELARLMDEGRRLLWPPIPWVQLMPRVRNAQGGTAGEKEAREALRVLHDRGQRPWYGFTEPIGLPHEDPARNETWGPRSRDDVEWTGF